MNLAAQIRILLKKTFVRLRFDILLGRLDRGLIYFAYLCRFAKWMNEADPVLSDKGKPFSTREQLYAAVSAHEGLDSKPLTYLEFGVAKGHSIRWWVSQNSNEESRFVGFDTFHGLPEGWRHHPKGTFSTGGQTPEIDPKRCSFETGLFQETLLPFLRKVNLKNGPRKIIHLDGDLYGSTLYPLITLLPELNAGDILIFDEFCVVMDEFRALEQLVEVTKWKFRVLGMTDQAIQVAMVLT